MHLLNVRNVLQLQRFIVIVPNAKWLKWKIYWQRQGFGNVRLTCICRTYGIGFGNVLLGCTCWTFGIGFGMFGLKKQLPVVLDLTESSVHEICTTQTLSPGYV